MKRLGDKMPEPVVTHTQIEYQLPVDAPVVLQKETEVDHPESEIVLAGIEDDRVRLVRHQLLKVQIRESHRVGAWTSARRKTQDSTELPGMLALQICELLLE